MARSSKPLLTALSAMIAVAAYSAVNLRPILVGEPGPLRSLRTAFWHDQLGYLSIVADVASGNLQPHEPMTETGVNHYPRTYYTLVGLIARLLGIDAVFAWNAVSVTLQLSAVVALAVTMSALSRRWWVGMLAPLPFLTGTFATLTGGSWFTALGQHAVLWGPYGVLFSNNAETAGLSLIIVVLCALAWVWARPSPRGARIAVSCGAAAILGVLSGFQTYSFLAGIYVVTAIIAGYQLTRARWWWSAATIAAAGAVVFVGPRLADHFGQLPTLVFGLLPAAPGLVLAVIASRGVLLAYAAIAGAFAAPQILWTVSGIVGGDPFLTYRVASNHDLGVAEPRTLVASLAVVLPLLFVLIIAVRMKNRLAVAALGGSAAAAVLLSLNDTWGANAEPYRFWIDMFLICGVVTALSASHLAGVALSLETEPRSRRARVAVRAGAALCAVVYAVSLTDAWAFVTDPMMNETWNPDSSRERAIAAMALASGAVAEGALVVTDECIDPRTVKVTSAQPIAYFYLGMAWPAEVDAVAEVMSERLEGELSAEHLRDSDTQWLLTDSACTTSIALEGADRTLEDSAAYSDEEDAGTITLWRVTTP